MHHLGKSPLSFPSFCATCRTIHLQPLVYDRYICSICSDFREALKSGTVSAEMQQAHDDHLELDKIQRSAFKAEKERAKSAPGLLVCVFDFSTSQETPCTKARIGSWVIIYTGNDCSPMRANLDTIAEHSCNYEFAGLHSYWSHFRCDQQQMLFLLSWPSGFVLREQSYLI